MAGTNSVEAETKSEQRLRGVYLGARVKVLLAEAKQLEAEARSVAEQLRALGDKRSAEAKVLKARRFYLITRPAEARAQVAAMQAERKALAGRDKG